MEFLNMQLFNMNVTISYLTVNQLSVIVDVEVTQ